MYKKFELNVSSRKSEIRPFVRRKNFSMNAKKHKYIFNAYNTQFACIPFKFYALQNLFL